MVSAHPLIVGTRTRERGAVTPKMLRKQIIPWD